MDTKCYSLSSLLAINKSYFVHKMISFIACNYRVPVCKCQHVRSFVGYSQCIILLISTIAIESATEYLLVVQHRVDRCTNLSSVCVGERLHHLLECQVAPVG